MNTAKEKADGEGGGRGRGGRVNVLRTEWQWRLNMALAGAVMGGGAAAYTRQKAMAPLIGSCVFGGMFAVAG